jgi:hypothetical protein
MRRLLPLAAALLGACASTPTPAPAPQPVCPEPVAAGGAVYIRVFDGVLTLPPGYVFDGRAVGDKTLFQGPSGAVRLGRRAELAGGYMDYVRATLKSKEGRCGLEILRHGSDDPPLWLLLGADHYVLAYDHDPRRVPALIEGYCASRAASQAAAPPTDDPTRPDRPASGP